jgi:excinuclease ABC subunit B
LLEEITIRAEKDERVLVTTLTKRMAEELTEYLLKNGVRCTYIHSDVDTLERVQILDDLRAGLYDVLIGVNLLREGLDLPQVSLVAILDADKEGFLRSHRALTQTAGRAARNLDGKVIMYADTITESMQKTIDETIRRRNKQNEYNKQNNITPTAILRDKHSPLAKISNSPIRENSAYMEPTELNIAADPIVKYMTKDQLLKAAEKAKKSMLAASKEMDYIQAAQYRDEMMKLQDLAAKTK